MCFAVEAYAVDEYTAFGVEMFDGAKKLGVIDTGYFRN